MLQRTRPVWGDPYQNGNGDWYIHVENLHHRDLDALYRHDVISGNPVFPHPQTGKAHVRLQNVVIRDRADAFRAWWWLREDIGVETFFLAPHLERAMNETVLRAPRTVEPDEPNEDDLSPYGELP